MPRRWGIVGAGAVGGYFGFRLAQAGQPVRFLARGETLRALRGRGLQVTMGGVPRTVRVEAEEDPASLADRDTVLIAVKHPDLDVALEAIRRGLAERAFAVTLQNGLEAPARASDALGGGRVVAGIAYLGAERTGPGEIRHTSLGRLTIGEPGGGASLRCAALAEDFLACGIPARASERIVEEMWKKLAWNAAFNGPTALARCSPAAIVAEREGETLSRALAQEVTQAAAAEGVQLPAGLADDQVELSRSLVDLRTSMLQDLEAGRPLETEALYGGTLRRLRAAGIGAPAHQAIVALLGGASRSLRESASPRPRAAADRSRR